MRTALLIFTTLFLLGSCNQSPSTAFTDEAESFDASGFSVEPIPGTGIQRVVRYSPEGLLLEEGQLRDGKKEGAWLTYHDDGRFPKTMVNFAEGLYNGLYLEFNDRGQLTLRATYKNNKLHGPWGQYKFGRAEAEAVYKDGELDGTYKEYDTRTGKLQKEINYKDGKQHGMYRFYNEEGEVTLEYEYTNGEKVSGGIIEGEESEE